MTATDQDAAADTTRALRSQEEVEARIRAICFKTGPPAQIGAELEWTLHHAAAPQAPLDAGEIRRALGRYTPATLEPHETPLSLPAGGRLTTEPGGQLEISSAPAASLADLHAAVTADLDHLTGLLDAAGLRLGEHGIDPYRAPRRLLDTPRYAAMEQRLRHPRPARPHHDGQHRRPAGLPRRRPGRRAAHPVGGGARARAAAGRSVRQFVPARRPGDRARLGPDGDLVGDGSPADPSAGRAAGRPGGRVGALRAGGAAGLRAPPGRRLGPPPGVTLRRLGGRGAARAADRRGRSTIT